MKEVWGQVKMDLATEYVNGDAFSFVYESEDCLWREIGMYTDSLGWHLKRLVRNTFDGKDSGEVR